MKIAALTLALAIAAGSQAFAQKWMGSSAGSTSNGASGAAGSTPSNGDTISGTGGSPGPNTSNAQCAQPRYYGKQHGDVAKCVRPAAATHGNAVDTPRTQSATQSLGNTDAGALKK
jgi:hypothetical protein